MQLNQHIVRIMIIDSHINTYMPWNKDPYWVVGPDKVRYFFARSIVPKSRIQPSSLGGPCHQHAMDYAHVFTVYQPHQSNTAVFQ